MLKPAHSTETTTVQAPGLPPVGLPSLLRACVSLVWLSFQRQSRSRHMVWIALALLTLMACWVALITALDRWGMSQRRWSVPPRLILTATTTEPARPPDTPGPPPRL